MKFKNQALLMGIVGKSGTGKLDNGETWTTDRVDLHIQQTFDESDSMSHGDTATVYQLDNYSANYELSKSLVGQVVELEFEMVAAKKLGQAPKMVCRSIASIKSSK